MYYILYVLYIILYILYILYCKRCDWFKDLERKSSFWVFHVGPKCNHTFAYERGRGRQRPIQRGEPCEDGSGDPNVGATGQQMPIPTGSWKTQGMVFLPEPVEGVWPCKQLGFLLLLSTAVRGYTFVF